FSFGTFIIASNGVFLLPLFIIVTFLIFFFFIIVIIVIFFAICFSSCCFLGSFGVFFATPVLSLCGLVMRDLQLSTWRHTLDIISFFIHHCNIILIELDLYFWSMIVANIVEPGDECITFQRFHFNRYDLTQ